MGGSWVCEAFTFGAFPSIEAGVVRVSVMVRRNQVANVFLDCRGLGTTASTDWMPQGDKDKSSHRPGFLQDGAHLRQSCCPYSWHSYPVFPTPLRLSPVSTCSGCVGQEGAGPIPNLVQNIPGSHTVSYLFLCPYSLPYLLDQCSGSLIDLFVSSFISFQ